MGSVALESEEAIVGGEFVLDFDVLVVAHDVVAVRVLYWRRLNRNPCYGRGLLRKVHPDVHTSLKDDVGDVASSRQL